jgi:hypothetical protein
MKIVRTLLTLGLMLTVTSWTLGQQESGGGFGGPEGGNFGGEVGDYGGGGYGEAGGYVGNLRWNRPASPEPFWLTIGQQSVLKEESMRKKLQQPLPEDLITTGNSLSQIINRLSNQNEITISISKKLEVDPQVDLKCPQGMALRVVLGKLLQPLDLTYCIEEGSVTIVSKIETMRQPSLRIYDLGFIQSDNRNGGPIAEWVQSIVQPFSNEFGALRVSLLGQRLVVSAPESVISH